MENKTSNSASEKPEPNEVEVFWAFTAYLIFFLPLLSKYRKSEFVRYHLKQGVVFFILFLIAFFSAGTTLFLSLKILIYSVIFVFWCFGVTHVFLGKEKPLPIFGWVANKFSK